MRWNSKFVYVQQGYTMLFCSIIHQSCKRKYTKYKNKLKSIYFSPYKINFKNKHAEEKNLEPCVKNC